jgi:hypothetical protein
MINRRNWTAIVLAGAMVPTLSGCFWLDDLDYWGDDYYPEPTEPIPGGDGTILVDSSYQQGDMGDIRAFQGDATATYSSYSGTYASIRLDSVGDGWWVMSSLNVSNVDILTAPAGTYRNSAPTDVYDSTAPYVSFTGCSGPDYGNYTFDSGSSDAEITISDNADGSRTIDFTATYENYSTSASQVVTGSIVYRQGDTTYYPTYPTYEQSTIVATDAVQNGDMGEIQGYSSTAAASEGYSYGSSASIRLDSVGSGWWAMTYLSVNNLDLATAPEGTYTSISTVYNEGEPQINVTACSGPSQGNYTYDSGADQVELQITDNADGTRNLQVTARLNYNGSTQVAYSSFNYTVTTTGTVAP